MESDTIIRQSPFKRIVNKIKGRIRPQPAGDVNYARIKRRKAIISLLTRRLSAIKWSLFLVGYVWMVLIPIPQLSQGTYIDENAIQPNQVSTYWNWADVHKADRYLEQLEGLRDANSTSAQRAHFLANEFNKLGIVSSTQNYNFSTSTGAVAGVNAYAILSSPRSSGTEAMVISASWLSRTGEGDGTLNLRGVATVLSLAGFLKKYSLWAKDIVFVVSDGYLDGMHAWLNAYHGSSQSNLQADPLELSSGVIWTALNIDYPGHSFSHLGVFFEGLNGRLPNQDLLNTFQRVSRYTGGVPVTVYDHLDAREFPARRNELDPIPPWVPKAIRDVPEVRAYAYQAKNVVRHVGYQARGRASGVHGLLHQFRIDAITLFAVPATGPHGFHAIGRVIESTLRSTNNLLERLHASFFFFILTDPERFLKIGSYLPSAILISIAMMFGGLRVWVDAAWTRHKPEGSEKDYANASESGQWVRRRRPVIQALCIMIATHLLGAAVFSLVTRSWFVENRKVVSPILFAIMSTLPLTSLFIPPSRSITAGPLPVVLKALNLCFASTIISITAVLNFSLAASLAVFLGIPLSISSPSPTPTTRILRYLMYPVLGFGWLLLGQDEMRQAVWNWEVLGVWFAPFVCIVYMPLVIQAGLRLPLTKQVNYEMVRRAEKPDPPEFECSSK